MKKQFQKLARSALSLVLAAALVCVMLPGIAVYAEEYVSIGCNDQNAVNEATVTVKAGQTVEVEATHASKYILSIKADSVIVTYKDLAYVSENGEVALLLTGGEYTNFSITNRASKDQELKLVFTRFQGHMKMPVELERMDDVTIEQYSAYEFGPDTGTYLTWTAPSDGTVVLDATEVESKFDGMQATVALLDSKGKVTQESIDGVLTKQVQAGDVLTIRVKAQNQFNLPLDAKIHLKADFDGSQPDGSPLETITPIAENLTEGVDPSTVPDEPPVQPDPPTEPTDPPTQPTDPPVTEPTEPEHECYVDHFTDVDTSKWYHEALDYMVSNGYMNGMSATNMGPNENLTRAQWAKLLYEVAGKPSVAGLSHPFTDVPDGKWYTDPVIWAYNEGIVKGVSATTFGPNTQITREQMATMLYRFAGSPKTSGNLASFNDASKVGNFAWDAMVWATKNSIVNGVGGGKLDPKGNATRAQAAKILYEYDK